MEKGNSMPPCYIYDYQTGKWQPFKTLLIYLEGQSTEFFRYDNVSTKFESIIYKTITYDYIAYYLKSIPSALKNSPSSLKPSSIFSNPQHSESVLHESPCNLDIKSMIVLEDLELRYESVLQEDQYIILGFHVANSKYGEDNVQIKEIRNLIADLHLKLKYSEGGLVHQVSERFKEVLFKSLKYSLSYIGGLFNIAPESAMEDKLQELHRLSFEPGFQEYLRVLLRNPEFYREVESLTYKAIGVVGLFPAYVELNTMNETGVWLKLKNLMTNQANAPYGSRHHASFSLGNFRYSFIFEPRNKDKQKVSISSELERGFNIKTHAFEYFRVKFFDFFPMDSWVRELAGQAMRLLHGYFPKTLDIMPGSSDAQHSLRDLLHHLVEEQQEEQGGRISVCHRIAKEFYDRYRTELDQNKHGKVFKKITKVISDAEVRGYQNLSNNCQTIVSEIIAYLAEYLQKFVEPLFDMSKIPFKDDTAKQEIKEFLKFGSQFNYKFSQVAPFPLVHRLSYFDTFSDMDSCELLFPKNYENMQKIKKEYFKRTSVKIFLQKIEEALNMSGKIQVSGPQQADEARELPDIDLAKGGDYTVVSCLVTLVYNELFNIRREIKIARYCEAMLQESEQDVDNGQVNKKQQKEKKKWKVMTEKMAGLYASKYKMLDLYKELCFYYYNTVRLGMRIKLNDSVSCLGCLVIRKPDYVAPLRDLKERSTIVTIKDSFDAEKLGSQITRDSIC